MKSFVTLFIPLVGAQNTHAVNMRPIRHIHGIGIFQIWIFILYKLTNIIITHFRKVFIQFPFPDNMPLLINLNNCVINQHFICNSGIITIFVHENQCVPAVHLALHLRHIIAYRIPLPLIIMVLSKHPLILHVWISLDKLILIKLPNNISIPVHLYQIYFILITDRIVPFSAMPQHLSARQ